jgi:Kef-type K+ transport system membrane component KefB
MDHLTVSQFLGLLVIMLAAARLCGALAKAVGQPTVLGELVAGVLLGYSVLGLVDPRVEVIHLIADLGVILLLFAIGLETDFRKLFEVGGTSAAVASVGVLLPFALGYGANSLGSRISWLSSRERP